MSQEHTPHEIQPVRTGREPSGRGVSRRSFVRLAVGALTSLPAVAGGVLVGAPAAAIAEEAARGEEGLEALADSMSSGVITVMAVRYDEVCISVVDVTRGRRRARPVAGARVKITSYYNKKSMEVTTNKDGLVVARVGDLAEDEPKKESVCTFSAYVEMSAPGYRIFKTGRATLTGGRGLELATMELEEGVPYPSRVTFADWDILYTNHGFCSAASNDLNHKIQVELEGVTPWRQLTVKFMDNKDRVYAEGAVTPTSGHVTVSIAHKYLQRKDDNRYALPIGGAFLVRFYQDGVEYSVPVSIIVCPPGAKDDGGLIEDTIYRLQPFADIAKNLEFRLPDWMGPLAGHTVRFFPNLQLPISFAVNPSAGLYGFSFNITGLLARLRQSEAEKEANKNKWRTFYGFKTQNGKPDPDAWKYHGTEYVFPDNWEGFWSGLGETFRLTYARNASKYSDKYKEMCDRLGLKPFPKPDDSNAVPADPNAEVPVNNSQNNSQNNIQDNNDNNIQNDSQNNNDNDIQNNNDNNNQDGDRNISLLSSQSEREGQAPAGGEGQWLVPMGEEELVAMEDEGSSYWDRWFQLSFWVNTLFRYDWGLDLFQVTGNFAANVKFGAAWVFPFVIPFTTIPAFFSLELNFDVTLGAGAYAVTPEFFSFSKYTWDPSTQTINLLFNPSFTGTLAAGVKGFASIGGFMTVGASVKVGYSFTSRVADNKNLPEAAVGKKWHTVVGLFWKGGIFAQCFLIYVEFSWPIKADPAYIDNWREKEGVSAQASEEQAAAAQMMEELSAMSFGELYDDPRTTSGVVPEDALGELVEFEGNYDYRPPATQGAATQGGGLAAQGEGDAAQGEGDAAQGGATGDGAMRYETYEAGDGSTVTVPVMMLNIYDADPEPQKGEAEGQRKEEGADKAAEQRPEGQEKAEGADQAAQQQPAEGSDQAAQQQPADGSGQAAGQQPAEGAGQAAAPEGAVLSAAAAGGEAARALTPATGEDAGQPAPGADQPEEGAEQPAEGAGQPAEGTQRETDPGQPAEGADKAADKAAEGAQRPAEAMSQEDGDGQKAQKDEGLEPQAQEAVPRPAMFGDYVPVRDQLYAQAEEFPGVRGLGREGGFVPTVDTVFAGDVFSDPRAKVVEIEGTPHVFRLASVKIRVDGREVYRTRVVCQQMDPSAEGIGSQVFDLPDNDEKNSLTRTYNHARLRREDCFDYDFDVCVEYETNPDADKDVHGYIHLVVISGERKQDDQADLATILSSQGYGYASYKFGGADRVTCSLHAWLWFSADVDQRLFKRSRTRDYEYHTFSCPQITVADPGWQSDSFTRGAHGILFAVLDFASDDERAVLNKRAGEPSGCDIGYCVFCVVSAHNNNALVCPNLESVDIRDDSIYGMTLSDAIPNSEGMHLLQLFGKDGTYAILTNLQWAFILGYAVTKMRLVSFPDADDDVDYKTAQLRPWRAGNYIASLKTKPREELGENACETRIYRVDLVDGGGNPITSIDQDARLVFTGLGLDGHGIKDFCVHPSGDTIFWPVAREDAPVMREDENGDLYDTGETESYYAVKACDFWSTNDYADDVTGEFRDPYVFAEVSHRVDMLTLPRASEGGSEQNGVFLYDTVNFISSEVLDLARAKGNVWLTRVPVALCLTVISIEAVSRIVLPGQDVEVKVGVRNDGNNVISWFDAQVCKTDGTVLCERTLWLTHFGDEPNPLLESKWNPRKDDGTLEGDIYNGWLPPGKCGLYKLTFPIPDDWEDRVDIVVRIKSLDVPGGNTVSAQGGLGAMAEGVNPITYIEVLEDEPTETLVVSASCEVNADVLSPAAVTVSRPGDGGGDAGGGSGDGGNAGAGSGNGSGGGAGTGVRAATPRTGDDSGSGRGLGALGLAAAALGAGMAAYSRRRTELEAEEASEGERS